jgi:uncharacterized damage-inducible protein DinB
MSRVLLVVLTVAALTSVAVVRGQQKPAGLIGDLLADVAEVEQKITSLATALPDAAWAWRPGEGVRSSADVIVHVAADNYVMPAALGIAIPPAIGIDVRQFDSIGAYEKRARTRQQAMAELAASFTFLKQHIAATTDAQLGAPLEVFGRPSTRRATWVFAVAHLHEHLGQLIAYARTNNVKPPWSQ